MTMKMLFFYTLKREIDENAYTDFVTKMSKLMMAAKETGDLVSYASYKNILESPSTVDEIIWKSPSAWAKFWESKEYQRLNKKYQEFYLPDIKVMMLDLTSSI